MIQEEADMGKKKDSDPDSKEYGELSPLPGNPVSACLHRATRSDTLTGLTSVSVVLV